MNTLLHLLVTISLAFSFNRDALSGELEHPLSRSQAHEFITLLCNNDPRIRAFVDSDELRLSERLGIRYEGVDSKFLIAHDLDSIVKSGINSGTLTCNTEVIGLDPPFSQLRVTCSAVNYLREFYFKDDKLIFPSSYHSRNWKRIETEHFRFIVSDSAMPHPYCIDALEAFFDETTSRLVFTQDQLETIKREKIEYLLCRDEIEVKLLTGFESRGMYELATDRIITHFNCHFHELVHLLVNYKLHNLPLYTHSLLQEGIAVAVGGRGGIEAEVIEELGSFLVASESADLEELLSMSGWQQAHSSIGYPVSGLYNRFLIERIGTAKYLELYREYSGNYGQVAGMAIKTEELPSFESWKEFVAKASMEHFIEVASDSSGYEDVYRDSAISILQDTTRYLFRCADTVAFGLDDKFAKYPSDKFRETFPHSTYRGEKYLVIASPDEIQICNLYSGNLIANFVGGFRLPPATVPNHNGRFSFTVDKRVFEEALGELMSTDDDKR